LVNLGVIFKTAVIENYLKWRLYFQFRKDKKLKFIMRHFRYMPCPYRQASTYYRSLKMDPFVYGETPLWSVFQLFQRLNLKPDAKVLDIGAGDFKVAFFLEAVFGFHVFGIEKIPHFCQQANYLKTQLSKDRIEVIEGDFLKEKLPDCDVGFLFGSNLDDEVIFALLDRIRNIPLMITVSFPLSDYSKNYRVQEEFELPFLFGKTTVYINCKET
jgi:hypothetical protein